jgi:hypothetical protein
VPALLGTEDSRRAGQGLTRGHAVFDTNGLPVRLAGVDTIESCFLSIPKPSHPNVGGQLCSRDTTLLSRRHTTTTMLERIGVDQKPVEWRPSYKTSNRRGQSGRESQERLKLLTARFRNALKKSVEGIIEAGRVLIEAKNELEHGEFINSVVCDLRFGTRVIANLTCVRQKC